MSNFMCRQQEADAAAGDSYIQLGRCDHPMTYPHSVNPTGCSDSEGHGGLLSQLAWPAGSLGTAMYLFHSSALVSGHPVS